MAHLGLLQYKDRVIIMKKEIKELPLEEPQIQALNDKLDNICDKLDKLNKTNWFELFIGAIMTQITSLMIAKEHAQIIWDMVKSVFKDIIKLN